ncbi:MAG TPA: hypothetical protein ENH85_02890 [Candidatus Scalindua sp.]|nr:hypothetical protein [Candidatus Scalindua sp.]
MSNFGKSKIKKDLGSRILSILAQESVEKKPGELWFDVGNKAQILTDKILDLLNAKESKATNQEPNKEEWQEEMAERLNKYMPPAITAMFLVDISHLLDHQREEIKRKIEERIKLLENARMKVEKRIEILEPTDEPVKIAMVSQYRGRADGLSEGESHLTDIKMQLTKD